jgi:hypothetical protein
MATISITIPDAQLQRVLDGLMPPGDDFHGLTQAQAAKAKIVAFIKDQVRTEELRVLRIQAVNAAAALDAPDVA